MIQREAGPRGREERDPEMNRVLVVDDDAMARRMLARLLAAQGIEARTAEDGEDARQILTSGQDAFGAVILDWHMPRLDGLALLEWIKGQPRLRHTPVIMQTGDAGAEHVRAGIERGAFYYLTKPFHEGLLRSVVAAAISDHEHRRSLLRRLAASEDVFTLMVEGTFRFRTLADAEKLALRLGALRSREGESAPLLGLSELLFNAVEHGNLGITYDEKTRLLEEGRWEAEVARRLALPEQAQRFGEVRLRRKPGTLELVIADQGPGFDYARFLELDEQRVFDNHGRGIAMARLELDLEYIDPGNQVCVRLPVPG